MASNASNYAYQPPVGGEGGAGSVASRSGSGSSGRRSHASTTSSGAQSGQYPLGLSSLPAGVTVKVPTHHHHHHHQIHQQPSLYHPPMSGRPRLHAPSGPHTHAQLHERSAHHHHPVMMNDGAAGGGVSMSAGVAGSGGCGGRAYPPPPPSAQSRQEYGHRYEYDPEHQQRYSPHQQDGHGSHRHGSGHDAHSQQQHRRGQIVAVGGGAGANDQQHRRNRVHDGVGRTSEPPHEQVYQDPVDAPGSDAVPGDTIPTSCDAVLERIVAAAADVHHAVQDVLQLDTCISISSSPVHVDAAEEEEGGELLDANYDIGVDTVAGGGEGRRQKRTMKRRSDHTAVGDNGGAGADVVGGGAGSTTYDRRRAARRILRCLAALDEKIGTLSSSMLMVAAAADSGGAVDCEDGEAYGNVPGIANDEEGGGDDEGKTSSSLVFHDGEDKEKDQNQEQQGGLFENEDGTEKGDAGSEPIESFDRQLALTRMVADLLLVPTDVRRALLVDDQHEIGDNDGDNEDCEDAGEFSNNTGNYGIVRLLDESDNIACRVIVQYLAKSTDQYRVLASLVPVRPLPPWNSVDGLLGRVLPQFVAAGGDNTYPAYHKTTAMILKVINSMGSEYAAQGLPMEISVIDAFVLCHYLARRGLVDLTTPDATPDLKGGGADTMQEATAAAAAALQVRKLIVRLLGRLLECLAGARAGMGAFGGNSLLHCLVADTQRLCVETEHSSGTRVSISDVEDCVDTLSEYCTESMDYALDRLDGFNSLVKGATADTSKDEEGPARQGHGLGQSTCNIINDAHVEGLRETIRSVQIAVKTFSTLRQLGIDPEPSTAKSFVCCLSDFWAISSNKLINVARRPLLHGGINYQLSEDMQQVIDAAGQQLIHIGMLTKPSSTAEGRQRGGNKGSKRSTSTKEQKSARFVAIASALSQSQRGGGSDDLSLLLHGFAKRSIGLETSTMKFGDMRRNHAHDTKRQKRKVAFEDDPTTDERVGSRCSSAGDNGMDLSEGKENGDKDDPIFLLKKCDEEGAADSNLVNACLLSSLLLPEYPSLVPPIGCDGGETYSRNASFEESYKTSAAVATGVSIQSGSEAHIRRSLVCDPTNPWHELVGRRITDTLARRDAVADSASSKARGVLLRHAEACRAG